jgi:peptidoglycan/LPS O-acetylase OafA/YrhL
LRQAFALRRNWGLLFSPASAARYPSIDGLRATSIIWVVVGHLLSLFESVLPPHEFRGIVSNSLFLPLLCSDLGVVIFFVISGFLISDLLMGELQTSGRIDFGRFYLRRAARLLPAYYLALAVYCALRLGSCRTIWSNLLYVNNFITIRRQCMAWTWSLAVEEQFYILCPIALWMIFRWRGPARLAALSGLLAIAAIMPFIVVIKWGITLPVPVYPSIYGPRVDVFMDHLYDKTYTRCGAILVGIVIAYLHRYASRPQRILQGRTPGWIAVTASLAAMAAVSWHPGRSPLFVEHSRLAGILFLGSFYTVFAIATGFIVLMTLTDHPAGAWLRRCLSLRIWYPVGQLAYSIFLIHPVCILIIYAAFAEALSASVWARIGCSLLAAAASVLVATVMYLFVERPFMNARQAARRQVYAPLVSAGPR